MIETQLTTALRTPQGFRAWRLEHKLSQTDLARLLEVTNTTVHRWESSKRPIPHTVALALLYLGLTNVERLRA